MSRSRSIRTGGRPASAASRLCTNSIEPQLAVRKPRHVDRHTLLRGRLEDAAALDRLTDVFADAPVQLVAAERLVAGESRQDVLHDLGGLFEVALQLERVVHAAIAGVVELLVAPVRVVPEVRAAALLDQAVAHQRPGADDGVEQALVDHLGDQQALLGDGHCAGKCADDEALLVAGHLAQDVGRFAQGPAAERGLGHGGEQLGAGAGSAHVDGLQRLELVRPAVGQFFHAAGRRFVRV